MKRFIMCIILISILVFLSFYMQEGMTVDEKIEKVLSTIYSNDYEWYSGEFDYNKMIKLEKRKLSKVRSLFTQDGLESIKMMRLMTESDDFIRKYMCDTSVESIILDIRDTSVATDKVCYYTVVININFIDETKAATYTEVNGTFPLYLEDEEWLIGIILEDQYPFHDMKNEIN